MKTLLAFIAGTLAGATLIGIVAAQSVPERGINHIGMQVHDYEAAMQFYVEGLGAQEAYTVRNADGTPLLTYLQLNRETFVELIPVPADAATGITHFGLEVGDIDEAVARLRAYGADLADPGLTPAGARFTRVRDVTDVEIEVMEFGPDALQSKAMAAWPDSLPVQP